MDDFQCTLCGATFDGEGWPPVKPESCPYCDAPSVDIVESSVAEDNRRINKHDEFLEDESNDNES